MIHIVIKRWTTWQQTITAAQHTQNSDINNCLLTITAITQSQYKITVRILTTMYYLCWEMQWANMVHHCFPGTSVYQKVVSAGTTSHCKCNCCTAVQTTAVQQLRFHSLQDIVQQSGFVHLLCTNVLRFPADAIVKCCNEGSRLIFMWFQTTTTALLNGLSYASTNLLLSIIGNKTQNSTK